MNVYNNVLRIILDSDNVELMSQIFELTVKYRIRSLSLYIIKHQKEFEEYNLKVQGYSFDKLLNSLKGTELHELLVLKANSRPDYVAVDAISIKPVAPINT